MLLLSYLTLIQNLNWMHSHNKNFAFLLLYTDYLHSFQIHWIHQRTSKRCLKFLEKKKSSKILIIDYHKKLWKPNSDFSKYKTPCRNVTIVKWRLYNPSKSRWGGSLKYTRNKENIYFFFEIRMCFYCSCEWNILNMYIVN